jgi:hypothetical protein
MQGKEGSAVSSIFDPTAPSLQGGFPRRPADLPHGLIAPPEKVRELIERERSKHPPASFAKAEERLLNEWTLQYYFDYLGHEVLYRLTPQVRRCWRWASTRSVPIPTK